MASAIKELSEVVLVNSSAFVQLIPGEQTRLMNGITKPILDKLDMPTE